MLKKIGEATKDLNELTEEEIKSYNTWKCDRCGDVILEKLENGQTVSYICIREVQKSIYNR